MLSVAHANEEFLLLHERAIWWERLRAVVVADLHLGKGDAFRAGGVPVPDGATHADLARLSAVVERFDAECLFILGDLFHARSGNTRATLGALSDWRRRHPHLHVSLVRGNHDLRAGDPPASLGIELLDAPARVDPDAPAPGILLAHEPPEPGASDAAGFTLCGHLHPAVSLSHASGLGGLRAPCFWFSPARAVLPAFGSFTGSAAIRPTRRDRVFAVGPDCVAEVRPAFAIA